MLILFCYLKEPIEFFHSFPFKIHSCLCRYWVSLVQWDSNVV